MKTFIKLTSVFVFTLIFMQVSGQKITLESGSFEVLKNVRTLDVEYSYDNMAVGKFDKESDYVQKKVSEYNAKEPGTGDRWHESWINDRENRFHPRFEEEFNLMMVSKNVNLKIDKYEDSKYKLLVRTTFTEPGFNVGITRMNANINLEIFLVETDDPDNSIARLIMKNSPGRDAFGYDFDTGLRIQEAYAKGGKELAYYIWKNFLK